MGWIVKKTIKSKDGAGKEAELSAQAQERIAGKIADGIVAVQKSIAAKLNAQAQKIGAVNTRFLLGAVLIGFAVYCAYLLLGAFF